MRTWLSGLLSALVLVVGTAPPGYRHAHAGDDTPHHHRHSADDQDHSSDLHHHHQSVHQDIERAAVAHIHLNFLFMDFTLPGGAPTDSAPAEHEQAMPTSVSMVKDCILSTACSTVAQEFMGPTTISMAVVPVCRVNKPVPLADSRVSLCDTARHERSGVQLF